MRKQHFLIASGCVLLVLLALGKAPTVRQWLLSSLNPADSVDWLPASTCNPSETPCTYVLGEGQSLTLDIQPRPIRPIDTLSVDVQVAGVEASRLTLDLSGTDMDMGFNQAPLTELSNGHFAAETSIPVCTTGQMRWQISVLLDLPDRRVGIPFLFDAGQAR